LIGGAWCNCIEVQYPKHFLTFVGILTNGVLPLLRPYNSIFLLQLLYINKRLLSDSAIVANRWNWDQPCTVVLWLYGIDALSNNYGVKQVILNFSQVKTNSTAVKGAYRKWSKVSLMKLLYFPKFQLGPEIWTWDIGSYKLKLQIFKGFLFCHALGIVFISFWSFGKGLSCDISLSVNYESSKWTLTLLFLSVWFSLSFSPFLFYYSSWTFTLHEVVWGAWNNLKRLLPQRIVVV
jgi:hypothetical protein